MPRPSLVIGITVVALTTAACATTATQTAANQVAASEASTAPTAHRGAFVVTLGSDTIVVERFSRTANAYSVEQAAAAHRRDCSTRTSR